MVCLEREKSVTSLLTTNQLFGAALTGLFHLLTYSNKEIFLFFICRDVHPSPLTYDELWNKTAQYARAIKLAYPNSKIYGPVSWYGQIDSSSVNRLW